MARRRLIVAALLLACTREARVVTPNFEASAPTGATGTAQRRCLPVVADECGCVYTCGVGTETSPGVWSVEHPFWAPTKLKAKIAPWCVSGDCTEAFHVEIVCGGICTPKPADRGCHFEGDRCAPK